VFTILKRSDAQLGWIIKTIARITVSPSRGRCCCGRIRSSIH